MRMSLDQQSKVLYKLYFYQLRSTHSVKLRPEDVLKNSPKNVLTMTMIMIRNCFCGMVDGRKAFCLISSRDHCQRSSASRISDTPRAGFEPAQNLSSGLVEWSCAGAITTAPRRHRDVPYGPICNAKGRICSGTSLGRTQDVNLTIIHKMRF